MRMTDGTIREGVWTARFESIAEDAEGIGLSATLDGRKLPHELVWIEGDLWEMRVPIPPEMIGEGARTAVISDPGGRRVAHFTLVAGEGADEDLRAELALLRAELELLAQAFRRHCAEGS